MKILISKTVMILGLLTLVSNSVLHAEEFVILTSTANKYSADEATIRQQVKRLFLKQQQGWPNGESVKSYARKKDSAAHKAFTKYVLEMDGPKLAGHWLKLKQTTGETPPREVGSARMLTKLIGKYEGSLGIMTLEEAKAAEGKVKILFTFSDN